MRRRTPACVSTIFLLATVSARPTSAQEDLLALSFSGRLHRVDPVSGAITVIGAVRDRGLALPSPNAMGRDPAGHLYAMRLGRLLRFGVDAGEAILVARIPQLDVRGLSFADDGTLYAIVQTNPDLAVPDSVFRMEVGQQTSAQVLSTGLTALQSLTYRDGLFYSYQLGLGSDTGLVRIDVGGGSIDLLGSPAMAVDVQGLTFTSDGRLFGGRQVLYEFDPASGAVVGETVLDTVNGIPDLRGMKFVSSAVVELDFETEDDMTTPLVNGQSIAPFKEFGKLVTIRGTGPNLGAAIFDSTPGGPNDPSQDVDLLVGLGNVLILQSDQAPGMTVPDVFDRPNDDSQGGTLSFQFAQPVRPLGIDLIDIDTTGGYALVTLIDASGNVRVYDMAPGWSTDLVTSGIPGFRTLYLQTTAVQRGFTASAGVTQYPAFDQGAVVRIEVRLNGSGAVDNLCFERSNPRGQARPHSLGGPLTTPAPHSTAR